MVRLGRGQSEYTREKQEVFETIIAAHLAVVKAIKTKHRTGYGRYTYVDLNAGPGFNDDAGVEGSPVITARRADDQRIPMDMWLFESDPARREALATRLDGRGDCTIYGDHHEFWPLVHAWHRPVPHLIVDGLVYWDPFGDPIPVSVINGLVAAPLNKVDVLLHVNANGAYKRPRGRGHAEYQGRYLADDIGRINKKYWWVRAPVSDWQWTFFIGSNWERLPEFRRLGFHPLNSVKGLDILDRLNLSQREVNEARPRLPFVVDPPTVPTPTISDIRNFWLSAPSSCSVPPAGASDAASDHRPNRTI